MINEGGITLADETNNAYDLHVATNFSQKLLPPLINKNYASRSVQNAPEIHQHFATQ